MGMSPQALFKGIVSRFLPQYQTDGPESEKAARLGRDGSQFVQNLHPDFGGLADEGSYFNACAAAPQTGIATAAAPTAFSATNPFFTIYNSENAGNPNAKRIILDFAALVATAAGTGGTSLQVAVTMDNTARYTSGGTALVPKSTNGDNNNGSIATVFAGNITATAASSAVRNILGQRAFKGAIPVIFDTYMLKFGGVDQLPSITISTIAKVVEACPKVVIPPGWTALVHLWLPGQSGASSYIAELGWVER